MEASTVKQMYEKDFDGKAYIKTYYNEESIYAQYILKFLHDIFSSGQVKGGTMLELGSGPSVYTTISASARIPEIYLSDISEKNRHYLQMWLHNDPAALDYTWQFQVVAKLEQQIDWTAIQERARKAVKDILPSDVTRENPLIDSKVKGPFDVVASFGCLESYPRLEDYFRCLKNLSRLVRPGGKIVLGGPIVEQMYPVGDVQFPSIGLTAENIKNALKNEGFELNHFNEYSAAHYCEGMYTTIATKIK